MILYDLLACPICEGSFEALGGSLVCKNGHCFDLSGKNYVNLLRKQYKGIYENSGMYKSRRVIFDAGFFRPLQDELSRVISMYPASNLSILDAGCGEGSMLNNLLESRAGIGGVGVDISKSAVKIAAKSFRNTLWAVADICKLPLKSHSVDFVINMLTPACYSEFSRVLKPSGLLIKIVPGENYLIELREAIGLDKQVDRPVPSDDSELKIISKIKVEYSFDCSDYGDDLFSMTPLTTGKMQSHAYRGLVSVDFLVSVISFNQ